MLHTARRLIRILDPKDHRSATAVLLLTLLTALVEAIGIASIMPFLAVLANPDVIDSSSMLSAIYAGLGYQSKQSFLFALGAGTFVILVVSMIVRGLMMWAQLKFTFLQTHKIGVRLMRGYLAQSYPWFFDRHSADFSVKVLHETTNVVQNLLAPAMQMLANAASVALIVSILVVVDPVLAAAGVVVLAGVYGGVYLFAKRRLEAQGRARIEANEARVKAIQETFAGIKYLKVTGLEARFLDRFRLPSERMARLSLSGALVGELPQFVMQTTVFGGMILVLLYLIGTRGSVSTALPVVGLYAIAGYRLMPALQGIYKSISQIRFALPSLDVLERDLLDPNLRALPDTHDTADTPSLSLTLRRELRLESISYTYPGNDKTAIDSLSLEVSACTTIGVVGSTGAGKTTLVDIILGLLSPTAGRMLVDGTPLNADNIRAWQRAIAYVPQSIFLLDDTVAMNIAFGLRRHEVDAAKVEQSARIANLHDFVSGELPAGYDTRIGEQGIRLSGGQRQRIGIARALYHDPDVIVFDEATSALDNITEQVVMDAVRQLGRTKTIILIAHRLTTVRDCDRILVLDRGKIVADGPYDKLFVENDQFRSMVTSGR